MAIVAAAAGCSGPVRRTPTRERPSASPPDNSPTDTSPPPEQLPHAEQFGTVVDAVAEGADPRGGSSLIPVLDRVADEDTMVYLPEGRYLVDDYWAFTSFENFGIVGDNAMLVPPEGNSDSLFSIGSPGQARGFLLEGVTFDFRAPETGGRPVSARVDDGLVVRDVGVVGTLDTDAKMFRFDVTDESGTGVVERLRLPDGATPRTGTSGVLVGDTNRGDIDFIDCRIVGFPDNGLYAEPPSGTMRVVGGFYANNDVSNVRINNGLVSGVHVRCDTAPTGFVNMRGIRLQGGTQAVVENCTVELLDVTSSDGGIVQAAGMDSVTIRNTRIRIDTDNIDAILGKPPSSGDGDSSLRCMNVCIEGKAAGRSAIHVFSRPDCLFDNVVIHQTGSDRNGITLFESDGSVIRNSQISVTGRPLVLDDSEIVQENLEVNTTPAQFAPNCLGLDADCIGQGCGGLW